MKTNKGTALPLYSNVSECGVCGEVFSSPSGFDTHRTGKYPDKKCQHPTEVGMEINSNGYWAVPLPEDVLKKLREARNPLI